MTEKEASEAHCCNCGGTNGLLRRSNEGWYCSDCRPAQTQTYALPQVEPGRLPTQEELEYFASRKAEFAAMREGDCYLSRTPRVVFTDDKVQPDGAPQLSDRELLFVHRAMVADTECKSLKNTVARLEEENARLLRHVEDLVRYEQFFRKVKDQVSDVEYREAGVWMA